MKPIEFKNVTKYFEDGIIPKKTHIIKNISFNLEEGKTYAYLGPNGAGKTTTIKLMLDLLRPSIGEILIYGKKPSNPEYRSKIGYVSDHPYFYEYLSAQEYLDFCGSLYNMPLEQIKARAKIMFEMVGLNDSKNVKLRKFSRGMGQRLSLAQALLHDPDLVILDEPLNGLDPLGRRDVLNIILDLKKQGKTIFFSSHILDDAELLADKLIFLNKGKIIFNGDFSEIKNESSKTFSVNLESSSNLINSFCQKNSVESSINGSIIEIKGLSQQLLNDLLKLTVPEKINIISIGENLPKLEEIFLKYYRGNKNGND